MLTINKILIVKILIELTSIKAF